MKNGKFTQDDIDKLKEIYNLIDDFNNLYDADTDRGNAGNFVLGIISAAGINVNLTIAFIRNIEPELKEKT